jgi:hypothetical protein
VKIKPLSTHFSVHDEGRQGHDEIRRR